MKPIAGTEMNKFKKLKHKLKMVTLDIEFLKKCKKQSIFPKFTEIKCSIKKQSTQKILNKAKKALLNTEIKHHHASINNISLELYNMHMKIIKTEHFYSWNNKLELIEKDVSRCALTKSIKLERKFRHLKQKQKPPKIYTINRTTEKTQKNAIINLSSSTFNEKEITLLEKGLKHKIKPKQSQNKEIIINLEANLQFMPYNQAEKIREECKKVFEQTNPQKHIYNKTEHNLIKNLKSKEVFYTKPDKSNGIVIFDKNDYMQRMETHINEGKYKEIKDGRWKDKNPLLTMQTQVKNTIKSLQLKYNTNEYQKLILPNPKLPEIYGLLKTHKTTQDMRPIISGINSPTSSIAKWLVKQYKMLNYNQGMAVKNSIELINHIKNNKLKNDEILISFDVKSLYPSVPIEETIQYIENKLKANNTPPQKIDIIITLTKLCMQQTQFKFNNKNYKSTEGANMGNPLSSLIAEECMKSFEEKIKNEIWFPRVWKRYVDDIIAIVKKDKADEILTHLNNTHPNIKFTLEKEKENSLPFLDITIKRNFDNSLSFGIHHKPTSSPQIINNSSHHPKQHKHAAFHTYCHRLVSLPITKIEYEKELEHIYKLAADNGYKKCEVDKYTKNTNENHIREISQLYYQ